jgi:hypothetical protein
VGVGLGVGGGVGLGVGGGVGLGVGEGVGLGGGGGVEGHVAVGSVVTPGPQTSVTWVLLYHRSAVFYYGRIKR